MAHSHNQLVVHHKAHAKSIRVPLHQDIHPAAARQIVINGQADHHNRHRRHRIDRRRMCQAQVTVTPPVVAVIVAVIVDHRIIHHRISRRVATIREMTTRIGKKRLMHGKQHPAIGKRYDTFFVKKILIIFCFQ